MEQEKVNEKLDNIAGVVMREASEQGRKLLEDAEKEKARVVEEREIALLKKAYGKIQNAIHAIYKESNELFSSKLNELRKVLFKKREEITGIIFQEVKAKLEEYRNQEIYADNLKKMIMDGINEAGAGKVTVVAEKRDFKIIEDFKKEKKLEFSIKESDTPLLGGCIVINTERGILSDNSFISRFEQQKRSFMENSGLNIEV